MIRSLILALLFATPSAAFEFPAPVTDADYRETNPNAVAWGRLLFWDPILSGNRTISCGTCHHPQYGTGDGLSLGLGDGGVGLGPSRVPNPDNPPPQRIARNAPGLWNLGAREVRTLFHDGRIAQVGDGLKTPFEPAMVRGYDSLLSVQTLFPVLSPDEMAGHGAENEVASAVADGRLMGTDGALDLIARRVEAVPEYRSMWQVAYPDDETLDFADISNAIAQFIEAEWRSDTAPFDLWMRGEGVLHPRALEGAELFYGAAGCAACHSGPFQTDYGFHAMGQPQLGPGFPAASGGEPHDPGRYLVTGEPTDRFAFRTPSLRNVTETGPWGHAGAYADLRTFVRAHAAPRAALMEYERQAILPPFDAEDWVAMDDPDHVTEIRAAMRGPDRVLSEDDLTRLMAFLEALRDETALAGRDGIPDTVPSGLPVEGQ